MRHVERPQIRHRIVVEVKHLLASGATAAHTIVGPILLAVVQRVGGGCRIDWTYLPAIHEVPRREDLGDGIAGVPPAKVYWCAVGSAGEQVFDLYHDSVTNLWVLDVAHD
jgi:hypothetical protein